jgi:hypothetical protein
LGAGPYSLQAHSTGLSADATATGGLQSSEAGNVALLKSTASITAGPGHVVATATSDAQVLTVGPLTIGQVTSTATMTFDDSGAKPSSHLEIAGLRIGGVAVTVTTNGLDIGGVAVPLPLTDVLASLLHATGVSIELLPAREIDGGVIAPALVITRPVDGQLLSAGEGTLTITVGGANASLVGASGAAPDTAAGAPATGAVNDVAISGPVAPSGIDLGPPPAAAAVPVSLTQPATPRPVVATQELPPAALDLRNLYLLFALCAGALMVSGQLIRVLGVKVKWTSTSG